MAPHEPTPGDKPLDTFQPAVNPAELKQGDIEKEIFENAKNLFDRGVESLGLNNNANTSVAEILFITDPQDLPKDFYDEDDIDEDYEIAIKIVPTSDGGLYVDYGYLGKFYGTGQFSHIVKSSGYKSERYGDTYNPSGVVSKNGDPNDLIIPLRYLSERDQVRISAQINSQLKTE